MTTSSGLRVSVGIFCATVALAAPAARADIIQLNTGLSLTWDRGASPTNSSNLELSVTNTGTVTNIFNGWDLSLQMIPQGGATGTLQVFSATDPVGVYNAITNPTGNALTNPDSAPNLTVATDANRGVFTALSNANQDSTQNVGTGGLVNISFNTTNGATGLFDLVAINQAASSSIFNPLGTLWIDSTPNVYAFSNPGIGFADGNTLVLGTINVLAPTSVPEPGSLLLLTVASGVFGGYGWRRKQRQIADSSDAVVC